MTVHVHDHQGPDTPAPAARTRPRPRWLVPTLVVAMVAGGLVLAGVLPLSTVLYGALFGGMILMHVGGHGGHGGNGGHGGHAGHGGGETGDTESDGDTQDRHSSRGCH